MKKEGEEERLLKNKKKTRKKMKEKERLTSGSSGCTPSEDAAQASLPDCQHDHKSDDDDNDEDNCNREPVEAENDISETFVLGRLTTVCCLHLPNTIMVMGLIMVVVMMMMMRRRVVMMVKDS